MPATRESWERSISRRSCRMLGCWGAQPWLAKLGRPTDVRAPHATRLDCISIRFKERCQVRQNSREFIIGQLVLPTAHMHAVRLYAS